MFELKKNFKLYIAAWAILLVLFNIVSFASQSAYEDNFSGGFWVGYLGATVAFIGQLVAAYFAFKDDGKDKRFLNIPIITTSYSGLVATTIISLIVMVIPKVPGWVGAIVCLSILAFNAVTVIKAFAVSSIAYEKEKSVKVKTVFIKFLIADAETLVAKAKSEEIKKEVQKVYEAIRFSDPMSDDALMSIENEITKKFNSLSEAVENNDYDAVKSAAEDVIINVNNRNNKCKALK